MPAKGISLVELLVVLAVGSLALTVTITVSVPLIAREQGRSAAYDLRTQMQRAKVEAVTRNHQCRMTVDESTKTLQVLDSMGTTGTLDDQILSKVVFPGPVAFARPDGGDAVQLETVSGDTSQVRFDSDATVAGGAGEVVLYAGSDYMKVEIFPSGGIELTTWDGSAWVSSP